MRVTRGDMPALLVLAMSACTSSGPVAKPDQPTGLPATPCPRQTELREGPTATYRMTELRGGPTSTVPATATQAPPVPVVARGFSFQGTLPTSSDDPVVTVEAGSPSVVQAFPVRHEPTGVYVAFSVLDQGSALITARTKAGVYTLAVRTRC